MAKTLEEQLSFLTGQVSVLGMALQAALKHHPEREAVAATLHENYEKVMARTMQRPFPEAFLDGMKSARDLYLLKSPDDPGQPKRG